MKEYNEHFYQSKQRKTILKKLSEFKNNKEIPKYLKLAYLSFIVAYIINPFDIVPDAFPVVGFLDDLIIVASAAEYAVRQEPLLKFIKEMTDKIKSRLKHNKEITYYIDANDKK
jgi:uncharacterized membrane protein YkvA (DUF1232 family)